MALNVPMTTGPSGYFPLPFPGEVFLLTRDKTQMSFRDERQHSKHLKGRLFMSNIRLVFLIDESSRAKANGAETFEMPFRGLWDEKFNQPLFSCNNLTATIQYYDDQPFQGGLTMRIDFVQGGVNTFLPVFNNVLGATRVQAHAQQQQEQQVDPIAVSEDTPANTDYFPQSNMAFVDPSDPTRLFTTQPAQEIPERRTDTPSWNTSAGGLRRRR